MTRSSDFSATIAHGARAASRDLVVHARRGADTGADAPRVGLVVAKSVGNAVQRHRVARRLRHVARPLLADLEAGDQVVIRALPSSRHAVSASLARQLHTGLVKTRLVPGGRP